jgi:hypothetical protein
MGLVMGKAKLTPCPEHTIPRMELCTAVLAVKLAKLITSEIDIELDYTTFHTDSKGVLDYIYNDIRRFYIYVSNRVHRIRRSTQPEQWRYVPTDQNPADHVTTFIPAAYLSDTSWLSGPEFLTHQSLSLERDAFELINPSSDADIRHQVSTLKTTTSPKQLGSLSFSRFSTWKSLTCAITHVVHIARLFNNTTVIKKTATVRAGTTVRQHAHRTNYLSQRI